MPKKINQSHVHDLNEEQVAWVLSQIPECVGKQVFELELPEELGQVGCDLYGPVMGDDPVLDAVEYPRHPRKYPSQVLLHATPRPTSKVVAVVGPYEADVCVLYTVYGGAFAPQEPQDPRLADKDRGASAVFWSVHALAYPRPEGMHRGNCHLCGAFSEADQPHNDCGTCGRDGMSWS